MLQSTTKAGMPVESVIRDLTAYNLWANKKIVDWLISKSGEIRDIEVPTGFSSINMTLLHIWGIQEWWLGNLRSQPAGPAYTYGKLYSGSSGELFDGITRQSELFVEYVQSLNEALLQEECLFNIPAIGEFNRRRYEIIQHCMHQCTWHRGQVVSIGRRLGLTDAP